MSRPAANGRPPAWDRVRDWMATLHDLSTAINVIEWDREVAMPPRGAEARGHQLGTLAALAHRELVRPEVEAALEELRAQDGHTPELRAMITEAQRLRERALRVPEALVREDAEASSRCVAVWLEARPANDFASYAEALEPVITVKRRVAEAIGMGDEPYDALLDEFEPGARARDLEPLFAELRTRLVPLASAAEARNAPPLPPGRWPAEAQLGLADDITRAIGFDLSAGIIAVSAHPFTQMAGRGDTRFTTRPDEGDPAVSILSTLHELGHALYDQGLDPGHDRTLLYEASSMGAHESQSRFWENHVGRLPAFWRWLEPRMRERFPEAMRALDAEILVRSVNRVEPSLIRIESDEVTYNLHIVLRFEIELALIRGDLAVPDLPMAWGDGMERLLGVRPPDDAAGVMQDIHWAAGLVGYFPTYTLGNLYAAQLTDALEADLGPLETLVERGEFAPILAFMRERVHTLGRTLRTDELMRRATGQELGVDAFAAHLERAYLA